MKNTEETLFSHHIFLFPFEWRYRSEEYKILEQKTDLRLLQAMMKRSGQHWERRQTWLEPQAIAHYNEAVYFFDFVRPVLYDSGKEESLLCHYYYNLPSTDTEYVIEHKEGKYYRLEVDDIVVSFYGTGVGVLAFHLHNKNKDQADPDTILRINQYGRRLFPPFFSPDYSLIGQQAFFKYSDWNKGLSDAKVKGREIAHSIRLEVNGKPWLAEDFADWAIRPEIDKQPGLIGQLLPKNLLTNIHISPVLDDRMFVVCWYGNDLLSDRLKEPGAYKTDDWWYKYIFIDAHDKTCQNGEMSRELASNHTYARWMNYGTLYGVSRYSLVCLTDTFEKNFFARILCSHIQTVYYKIALLSLVQRACVMRFSEEITAISQLAADDRKIGLKVGSLYKQYLRFINKIYFREVTAQEQGIEIYGLLQKHMRLEEQTQELEVEVRELHSYVNILEGAHRNEKLDILTYIGALLIGPSFVASFLGINEVFFKEGWGWSAISIFCILSATLALGVIRNSGRWRKFFLGLAIVLFLFFLFVYINQFY